MRGDSFRFAFPFARNAVAAAADAQRALGAHSWPDEPVRVRIGLHSGEPIQSGGLYAGLDVHRAARIMSASHGGQVLVSQTTRDLVCDQLPAGLSLRDRDCNERDSAHLHILARVSRSRQFSPGERAGMSLNALGPRTSMPGRFVENFAGAGGTQMVAGRLRIRCCVGCGACRVRCTRRSRRHQRRTSFVRR
jgi:hypothetical protein